MIIFSSLSIVNAAEWLTFYVFAQRMYVWKICFFCNWIYFLSCAYDELSTIYTERFYMIDVVPYELFIVPSYVEFMYHFEYVICKICCDVLDPMSTHRIYVCICNLRGNY